MGWGKCRKPPSAGSRAGPALTFSSSRYKYLWHINRISINSNSTPCSNLIDINYVRLHQLWSLVQMCGIWLSVQVLNSTFGFSFSYFYTSYSSSYSSSSPSSSSSSLESLYSSSFCSPSSSPSFSPLSPSSESTDSYYSYSFYYFTIFYTNLSFTYTICCST